MARDPSGSGVRAPWRAIAVRAPIEAVAREVAAGVSSAWMPEAQTMLVQELSGWTLILAADGDVDPDLSRAASAHLDTVAVSFWSDPEAGTHGLLLFEEGEERDAVPGGAPAAEGGERDRLGRLLLELGLLRLDWTHEEIHRAWQRGEPPPGAAALRRLED